MTVTLIFFLIFAAVTFWFGTGYSKKPMSQITQEQALEIAKIQSSKDKVSLDDLERMRVSIQKANYRYKVEWVPKDPYTGGFEYFVFVDSQTGKVLSSEANPLELHDQNDFKIKENP